MEDKVKCGLCGGEEWVVSDNYPFLRRCANPNCNGLHPHDISKLQGIKGKIFDADKREITDIEELKKRMK